MGCRVEHLARGSSTLAPAQEPGVAVSFSLRCVRDGGNQLQLKNLPKLRLNELHSAGSLPARPLKAVFTEFPELGGTPRITQPAPDPAQTPNRG